MGVAARCGAIVVIFLIFFFFFGGEGPRGGGAGGGGGGGWVGGGGGGGGGWNCEGWALRCVAVRCGVLHVFKCVCVVCVRTLLE
jgi:hypothetical protein